MIWEGPYVTITKRGVVVKSGKTVDGVFVTKFDEEGVYVITATKEDTEDTEAENQP